MRAARALAAAAGLLLARAGEAEPPFPLDEDAGMAAAGTDAGVELSYGTVVRASPLPPAAHDGTSTSLVTRGDVQSLPGGSSRSLNDVVATTPGITPDNYGAIHVRGNFAGLLLRVDGVQLPPSIQDRLQQLLEPQVIESSRVIVGGLPAEFGEQVAGAIDLQLRRPDGPVSGDAQLLYGTSDHVQAQANVGGAVGPLSALVVGSVDSTDRGLDPPAASPILHDQLQDGRLFIRLEYAPSSRDRLELLGALAQSNFQIPIDPTLLPLSDAPPGAVGRGVDAYGNTAPDFVPYDSNPTEEELEIFTSMSWFHAFSPQAQLQVTPFFDDELSVLRCDVANELGATADPGATCSNVGHRLAQGGVQVNQTLRWGRHDLKAGLFVDDQQSDVGYTEFTRDDASPTGGADPSLTIAGQDRVEVALAGVYAQDQIQLGKWTLFPGARLDYLQAGVESTRQGSSSWGPSLRLGAAYAFSDTWVLHAFAGNLWQPPSYDAPTAARALGLVAPGQPVPFDLQPELDEVAEVGLAATVLPQLRLSITPWGRLSQHTLDDNEVGDTALTADYNYQRGRAAGVDLAANVVIHRRLRGFANVTTEIAEGEGIASARYLFTPPQLAFTGYQPVDNAQLVSANAGVDLTDDARRSHLALLARFGSGLRTGPTNGSTLPPSTVIDLTLRHRFVDWPLGPEVAIDVLNVFDVVYAYRIATGSLTGTAYGPLRQVQVRLVVPWGSES